uniref:Uncharacterized protein n=1 Tax=Arundo donax TaxID=35708 RepID=A0A0A9A4K3_ARUDO
MVLMDASATTLSQGRKPEKARGGSPARVTLDLLKQVTAATPSRPSPHSSSPPLVLASSRSGATRILLRSRRHVPHTVAAVGPCPCITRHP